ncbi:hypothetical protein EDC44_10680 [Cricetibacter osteomyelitidis]|uniref:Permease n=1 Tax=Cricetibacter osteomyelitidis TaxID=1521931 RepID=A0A4R2T3J0_9PAST|nr:AEC family transporter [Cricetibacter osteomyelitidis]TCP96021.1 hypothetical protein EDC44_10680 [Cricetibacter osteomyelitidis]
MAVLQQMLIFFIFIVVGIYAQKKSIITPQNQAQLSSLVVRIAYPAIILSGAMVDGERISGGQLRESLLAMAVLLLLLLIGGWLMPKILHFTQNQHGAVNGMTVFSAIGFIGVPMIQAIYGTGALIYMTIFLIPFNLLFFSYGLKLIHSENSASRFSWRSVVNEGMIACLLAEVIYFGKIPMPTVVKSSVAMLGAMTAPLAMMLMGTFLSDIRWKAMLTDGRIWGFTLLKMVVLPLAIVLFLQHFVTANHILLAVCLAALASPTGNVISLLAAVHNKAAYQTTVDGVALTTLVAVITMPLVFALTGLG